MLFRSAFGKFFGSPRSREVVDMTAFCSPLEEVFNSRPRAAYNKTNNRDFAKNQKRANTIPFTTWENSRRVVLPISGGKRGSR